MTKRRIDDPITMFIDIIKIIILTIIGFIIIKAVWSALY